MKGRKKGMKGTKNLMWTFSRFNPHTRTSLVPFWYSFSVSYIHTYKKQKIIDIRTLVGWLKQSKAHYFPPIAIPPAPPPKASTYMFIHKVKFHLIWQKIPLKPVMCINSMVTIQISRTQFHQCFTAWLPSIWLQSWMKTSSFGHKEHIQCIKHARLQITLYLPDVTPFSGRYRFLVLMYLIWQFDCSQQVESVNDNGENWCWIWYFDKLH